MTSTRRPGSLNDALTISLFHLFFISVLYSKLIKKQANIMVQRWQKCYRVTYFNDVIHVYIAFS